MAFMTEWLAQTSKYRTIASVLLMIGLFSAALMYFGQNEDTVISHNLYRQILQQSRLELGLNETGNKKYLIFQIGFNKAGTSALKDFFSSNGIISCHYDAFDLPLAETMFKQHMKNESVLTPFFKNNSIYFQYYADFGVYVQPNQIEDILFLNESYQNGQYRTWYELLLNEEVGYEKLFILNIRNVNNWIKSRYRWHTYHCGEIEWFSECAAFAVNKTLDNGITEIEVLNRWKKLWYQYICGLLNYFESNSQKNKLIVFDIEHDSADKLSHFFNQFGFDLNASFYGVSHDHQSVKFAKKHPEEDDERLKKWNEIEKEYPEFRGNSDEYTNEHDRIAMECRKR